MFVKADRNSISCFNEAEIRRPANARQACAGKAQDR
jgi:hypothetical protein